MARPVECVLWLRWPLCGLHLKGIEGDKVFYVSFTTVHWLIDSLTCSFILMFIQGIFIEYLICVEISGHLTSIPTSKKLLVCFWDINFPPPIETLVGWSIIQAPSYFWSTMASWRLFSNSFPLTILEHPTGQLNTFSWKDRLRGE